MGEAHFRAKSYNLKHIKKIIIIILVLVASILIFPIKASSTVVEAEPVVIEEPVEWTLDTLVAELSEVYEQDEALVRRIIHCESRGDINAMNKNFNDKGQWWSSDYGPMQINNYWHAESAAELGLNIYDWQHSLEYGLILLSTDGAIRHWSASSKCWQQ